MRYLETIVLSAILTWFEVSTGNEEKTNSPEMCAYTDGQYCCPNSRRINFEKDNIVPDVLKSDPECIAEVVYDDDCGKNHTYVCLGNEITSDITSRRPRVSWSANPKTYYTLIMYGTLLSFDHWIVGNIPGNNVSAGNSVSDHISPIPPPATGMVAINFSQCIGHENGRLTESNAILNTIFFLLYIQGPHRYLFATFEQLEGIIKYKQRQDLLLRPFFDFDGFVEEHKLKLYAANFFLCVSNLTPFDQLTLL